MNDTNGNGNGAHSSPTQKRLEALLTYHETAAAALRTTLGLLRVRLVTDAQSHGSTVLAKALYLDQQRTAPRRVAFNRDQHKQRRARSAAFLEQFTPTRPVTMDHTPLLNVLVAKGYLKKKGDGYVRTKKPFVVDPWIAETTKAPKPRRSPQPSRASDARAD